MAFKNGIFDAPAVELAPCGLLSVARIKTWEKNDEQWLRGYQYEVQSTPAVEIVNKTGAAVTNGSVSAGSEVDFYNGEGFYISVEKTLSGMGILGYDPIEETREEILAASQKAAEYELWEGVSLLASSSDGPFLRKQSGATIVTSGGTTAALALRALEQSISLSPVGARGTIHMTRDVASELGNRLQYRGNGDSSTEDRAITRLGTRVVIGSGYTGNGPIAASGAASSATNKWMFATGGVSVHLGATQVVSDVSAAFNTSVNDALILLQRSAAVHFDPSIWYAAQVTLPTS
jgi:hypothetical protein